MSLLALDASGEAAGLAIQAEDGEILFRRHLPTRPGLIERLPALLEEAAQSTRITGVAVTIGPGSFTGLRTAIAIAAGFAAAAGLPLAGVTVAEAYRAAFPQLHRPLWVALRARPNRIFLLRDARAEAFGDADLPGSKAPVALAGSAANEAAARLAASGTDVLLTNARQLDPAWVALAARAGAAAGLKPHAAEPVYVDPPEARPAAGLRPPPAP
ncbi:MAG: tRNA (adenosine(37)-N6)-threonylcarbamoyltransferase complex dimerization subunit type 1 TsaB [Rhodospirillales bacterium 20-64-7]|nr:MAG: tRNA (adenosine(37)-N6)-threonylcarbamoyltransferase complex dimerization subunit type 1 TsaB [Rhodospirillales bacterium 20-64-7]